MYTSEHKPIESLADSVTDAIETERTIVLFFLPNVLVIVQEHELLFKKDQFYKKNY